MPASSSGVATVIRSGVEPPEPSNPTGLIAMTSRPSWSFTARTIASPRSPPTSRCAAFPRRYETGKTSFGVNHRNAVSPVATPRIAPNPALVGWSTARYIRANQTMPRMIPIAHFAW